MKLRIDADVVRIQLVHEGALRFGALGDREKKPAAAGAGHLPADHAVSPHEVVKLIHIEVGAERTHLLLELPRCMQDAAELRNVRRGGTELALERVDRLIHLTEVRVLLRRRHVRDDLRLNGRRIAREIREHEQNTVLELPAGIGARDRKSTRLNSSHSSISYAVFCLKKKK